MRIALRDCWERWKAMRRRARAATSAQDVAEIKADRDQADIGLVWYRVKWIEEQCRRRRAEESLRHLQETMRVVGDAAAIARLKEANVTLQAELISAGYQNLLLRREKVGRDNVR